MLTAHRLFKGTTKKLRVKRKTFDRDGRIQREDKDLEIVVRPGMKAESKFKFKGVGDEIEGTKQDLHFVVKEKPHALFVRHGDDLVATVTIPLKEALTGWSKRIQTIDGKNLLVSHGGPTPPTWQEVFPNQGMVLSKEPSKRGDLIIKVNVSHGFRAFLRANSDMIIDRLPRDSHRNTEAAAQGPLTLISIRWPVLVCSYPLLCVPFSVGSLFRVLFLFKSCFLMLLGRRLELGIC